MATEATKKTSKKTVAKTAGKTATKTVKKEAVVKKQAVISKNQVSEKRVVVKKGNERVSVSKKAVEKKYATVSVDVVGIDGKVTGKVSLPGEMFGERVNKALIAQAIRVYLANQRQGTASTKTRGEVDGSTRKIYRQKGTGRARHGSVRAPIFVKGGVVFGPKPRDYSLSLPQKMKRKALFSALSAKTKDKKLTIIDGLTAIKPKTKVFAQMLKNLGIDRHYRLLIITAEENVMPVLRAGRNIQGVSFIPSKQVNTYEILAAKQLLVMKDALDEMKEHFLKK